MWLVIISGWRPLAAAFTSNPTRIACFTKPLTRIFWRNSSGRGTTLGTAAVLCGGFGWRRCRRWRDPLDSRRQGDLGAPEYRGQGWPGMGSDKPVGRAMASAQLLHAIELGAHAVGTAGWAMCLAAGVGGHIAEQVSEIADHEDKW